MKSVVAGLTRVQAPYCAAPEVWRACRFIQISNNKVNRFGDSHSLWATKPWLSPKQLIKRQPLAGSAMNALMATGPTPLTDFMISILRALGNGRLRCNHFAVISDQFRINKACLSSLPIPLAKSQIRLGFTKAVEILDSWSMFTSKLS